MDGKIIMMRCGHVANGTHDGKPCCVICAGLTPDAYIVDDNTPDLTGRQAECSFCGKKVASKMSLPFFEHRPKMKYDSYYCGCEGWD